MSKEKSTKQMSLLEDFHANHSALQEKENQQQMIVTSGMKCLESLEKQNQDWLLEKMLKALLISTKAWYSDRCLMTWKTKVSKANVLLFQLQASVRGIKEKGSGLLPTPVVSDHLHNQSESIENWTKRSEEKKKQGINLHFALRHHVQMYPTPTTMDHIDRKGMRPSRAATNRKTGYLSEMIKMYPTPTQDSASERTQKYSQGGTPLTMAVRMFPTPTTPRPHDSENTVGKYYPSQNQQDLTAAVAKTGGQLNPQWVSWLMGYPVDWCDLTGELPPKSRTESTSLEDSAMPLSRKSRKR